MKKRLFAAFVSLCLIVSMLPTMAFAEAGVQDSGTTIGASGLCEHHTEHTADCGYTEGTAEIPCSHEHTEDCYTLVTECVHEHTAECYPAESVSENTATPSEPGEAEPTACTHECSKESGCITKTSDCKHEHDETCGYVPATAGTPCTFVCEVCNAQDSGNPATPSDAQPEECTCETLCIEEEVNADCPVCSAEGAELDKVCVGAAPMLPVTALAAGEHDGHSNGWTELTADTTTLSGGSYYLSGDVEYTGTASITVSGEVILCLNGHKLDLNGHHISVGSGASLTLYDCSTGGVLTGGSGDTGGGVYVDGGGTFTMTGGNITGNTANAGGGVYVDEGGTFTMEGGSICNNKATTGGGGGVMVNEGSFTLSGGSITGNTTNSETFGSGGGVCLYGTFYLSGDSIIQDNTKAGTTDNLYLGWNTINITGPLGENAHIGVTAENVPRSFISGWSDNMAGENPADYFSSDGDACGIGLNTAGDVVLGNLCTTITLNPNGGTLPEFSLVAGAALPIPSKTGYTFAGWYENPEFSGNPVTDIPTNSTENLNFYAKWTVNTYTVTFDANGGTINNGDVTEYTYGVGATLPTDVTREGYAFAGWYEQNDFSGSKVTEITTTDTGDKTYYAKWLSTDAGVASVSVNGVVGNISDNQITVTLPPNSALPDGTDDITITPAAGAVSSNLTISTGIESVTYTFTVTAEDGQTTADYTVTVTVADDPAAGNKADVDAAKTAVENHTWTVPQATANTEEAVKAWIEGQLAGMNLNGASYTLSMTGFTAAVKGTSADRDGTDGSFAFTVVLSKGTDTGDAFTSTYAEATATVTGGTITATAYTGGGGSSSGYDSYTITATAGEGGTISPSGSTSVREGRDQTYTITPDGGYHISDVLVDGKSVGAVTSYTFEDVQKKHTIEAVFAKDNPDTGVDNPFTDVHPDDWFYEAVMFVYQNNLMNGTSATTFSPNDATTRAQIAAIFYRMAGNPAVDGKNSFTDVPYGPGTTWYYDAVTWAQKNGILAGYEDGTFHPDDPITREQLAMVFYNYAKFKGYNITANGDLSAFTDAGDISAWAQEAMKWAVGSGLMNGKDNGIIDPKGTATRAEVAAMLHKFIENNKLVPPVVPGGDGGAGGTGSGGWTQHVPSPQTGDSSNIGLWFSLMLASLASLVVLTVSHKRKNEDEDTMPQLI